MTPGTAMGRSAPVADPVVADTDARAPHRTWRALLRDPAFWVGVALASVVVGASMAAPILAPYDPWREFRDVMPLDGSALPPSSEFPLGTDPAGRDYLSRLLYAGRSTLVVGLGATILATLLGLAVGTLAAYPGRLRVPLPGGRAAWFPLDTLLMRVTDIGLAFPALLLAIAACAVFDPSLGLVVVVMVLVLWTTTARLVHGQLAIIARADHVTAAHALGCDDRWIIRRHLVPHVLPLVITYATLGIATTIMFEAALSFVGAGAPQSEPTWGRLIAESAGYYTSDPRLPLLPGVAILVTVLAFNLIGEAVRDATDPRTARGR
jgi:peptide/nickel transport system permease protein